MPYKSAKQRRYIHIKANQGEKWAKDFVKDAKGNTVSKKKKVVKKKVARKKK